MYITLTILLLALSPQQNIALASEHLHVYEGEWKGTLTYLNYGDDKTLVDLPVRMIATFANDPLSFEYFYNEGDGRTEKRTGSFSLKGQKIHYNGQWKIETTDIGDLENWRLTLISKGKDNNRKARFRKIVEVTSSRIEVTKWVQYLDGDAGTDDYFVRNRHIFHR